MVKIYVTIALQEQILRLFKHRSEEIFQKFRALEIQPQKGKALGHVGNIVIKELKMDKFRFYFITDGHVLKFGSQEELAYLLIKFIRMSEKKDQQQTIDEIKTVLRNLGDKGL